MTLVDGLGIVVLLCALPVLAMALRRRHLVAAHGAIEAGLRRRPNAGGGGWSLGVLRFAGDRLEWTRLLSLSPRPAVVLHRSDLVVRGRRVATSAEHIAVTVGGHVLEVSAGGALLELALTQGGVPALLAWLEAAPPGSPSALAG